MVRESQVLIYDSWWTSSLTRFAIVHILLQGELRRTCFLANLRFIFELASFLWILSGKFVSRNFQCFAFAINKEQWSSLFLSASSYLEPLCVLGEAGGRDGGGGEDGRGQAQHHNCPNHAYYINWAIGSTSTKQQFRSVTRLKIWISIWRWSQSCFVISICQTFCSCNVIKELLSTNSWKTTASISHKIWAISASCSFFFSLFV